MTAKITCSTPIGVLPYVLYTSYDGTNHYINMECLWEHCLNGMQPPRLRRITTQPVQDFEDLYEWHMGKKWVPGTRDMTMVPHGY